MHIEQATWSSGPKHGATTEATKRYIDFAAQNGFAGVLVDVYCDHFLARDWDRLGDGRPLAAFLDQVHAALRTHHELLPPALQRLAPRLCTEGWIEGYAHLDGLERVFALMARRLPRPTSLATGAEPLRRHYDAFAADFAALWPQLTAQLAAPAK
jgi:acyl carrier protein phosphodiesterase